MSKFVFLLFLLFSSQSVFAQINYSADSALADLLGTIFGRKIEQGQNIISRNRYVAQQSGDKRYLQQGDESAAVKAWQTFLKSQNLYSGPIDGKFGSGTSQATKAFQNNYGLKADGILGENTIDMAKEVADTGIVREMSSVSTDAGYPISQSDFSSISKQTAYPVVKKPISEITDNYSEQMSLSEVASRNNGLDQIANTDPGILTTDPNTLSGLSRGLSIDDNSFYDQVLQGVTENNETLPQYAPKGEHLQTMLNELGGINEMSNLTNDIDLSKMGDAKLSAMANSKEVDTLTRLKAGEEIYKRAIANDLLKTKGETDEGLQEKLSALQEQISKMESNSGNIDSEVAKPEEGGQVKSVKTVRYKCDKEGRNCKEIPETKIAEIIQLRGGGSIKIQTVKTESVNIGDRFVEEEESFGPAVQGVYTKKVKIVILDGKPNQVADYSADTTTLGPTDKVAEKDINFVSQDVAKNMVIPEAPKQTAEVK